MGDDRALCWGEWGLSQVGDIVGSVDGGCCSFVDLEGGFDYLCGVGEPWL